MAKKIFYDKDARARVLGGAKVLFDAVKSTYGPNGNNVVIGRGYGIPNVTHDGVTVAEAIEIPQDDPEQLGFNEGAQWIKEAAKKLNKEAGDGTTSVTVLTYELMVAANALIAANHKPQDIRRGLEKASLEALAIIDSLAEPIENRLSRIEEVATISAGDSVIGKKVAEVIGKVGGDGVVTVEPGQSQEIEAEIVEGYSFDRGFASPFFITDDSTQQAVLEKPVIFVSTKKFHTASDIAPVIEKCADGNQKNIVLIADELDGDALGLLILNHLKTPLNIIVVKAPSFGDRRLDYMQDIATLVKADLITEDQDIDEVDLSFAGMARKVMVGKDTATIIEGAGEQSDVRSRVESIRQLAKEATNDFDKKTLTARAAALDGKVAIIKVGGSTETEIDEKKFRVDDAVAATRASLEEGIVAGGGVTMLDVAKKLSSDTVGHTLLKKALEQPFLHIMENNGLNAHALLAKVQEADKVGFGIDVMNPEAGLVDLKAAGVIDPARVTKEVVRSATSIAATAATTGVLVVEIPEKNQNLNALDGVTL